MIGKDVVDEGLILLKAVNFDWVMHMKSIWSDSNHDIENIHRTHRATIISGLNILKLGSNLNSPPGYVLVGQGGSGKTHLLSVIRKYALSQGFGFILVDMTDVRDFWETVLQGYVSSLQVENKNGVSQLGQLVEFLAAYPNRSVAKDQGHRPHTSASKECLSQVLSALAKLDMPATIKHQNVVRALFLLHSDELSVSSIGYTWLQGYQIDDSARSDYGFTVAVASHLREIVEGLSWVMSLRAPSVLAFDQLDSIVAQHHLAAGLGILADLTDEQRTSKAIIEGIGGGFAALHTTTARTLTLISCLETTWEILSKQAISPFLARFHSPLILDPIHDTNIAKQLVVSRFQDVYNEVNFSPPYPGWPFTQEFFEKAKEGFPRSILQCCDTHRNRCIAERAISELSSFVDKESSVLPTLSFNHLDKEFARLVEKSVIGDEDDDAEDNILPGLLQTALDCLIRENSLADSVDQVIETSFPGGNKYPLLHARVRLIYHAEQGREKHLCLRALQEEKPIAYQNRLTAAMTASGIDRSLSFRKLIIVRTVDTPGGAKTQKLTEQFKQAGGMFAHPTRDELRVMLAVQRLKGQESNEFDAWLRHHRPISGLSFLREAVSWLFDDAAAKIGNEKKASEFNGQGSENDSNLDKAQVKEIERGKGNSTLLAIGSRLIGQQAREDICIPASNLTKHTVILAGSGSGKTVLVRRIVEESLLLGIPAIVIDCANDLAQMGDRWPAFPETWREEDQQKADLYHRKSEVIVWTPGRESGNPLNLEPLPELSHVANDPEELEQATNMALDSLKGIVAPGNSRAAMLKQGILKSSLNYFAHKGGGKLSDLIELLSDLPVEAGGDISDAGKKAQEMADDLKAAKLKDPLLRQSGSVLDPAILLGLNNQSNKTRISIINFVGLPSIGSQQQFLNQLFMTLFTWIKKNPAPQNQPLRGLLVLDEAKDFVPSVGSTPCKASVSRLVAQARKYGLGIIFATQSPRSIDHNIIANCSTQFYGRANSPTSIEVIREQLRQRGGNGEDIAKLEKGQFYAVSESLRGPIKILTPLCLSNHPASPLDEQEVLKRARNSSLIIPH